MIVIIVLFDTISFWCSFVYGARSLLCWFGLLEPVLKYVEQSLIFLAEIFEMVQTIDKNIW